MQIHTIILLIQLTDKNEPESLGIPRQSDINSTIAYLEILSSLQVVSEDDGPEKVETFIKSKDKILIVYTKMYVI